MILHRHGFASSFGALLLSVVALLGATSPSQAALIDLTPATGTNSANSVNLADLVTGAVMGITVGDKIFTGFSYSEIGDMPAVDDVLVLGFKDLDGNWGLSFHGPFHDLPGNGASDAFIRFMVEVAAAQAKLGIRISDAHLFLGGAGVGENSFFGVDETFLGVNESMSVFKSSIGGQTQQLHDQVFFDPVHQKLVVTKDILAIAADNATQPARATVIDQSFSQTIPEPAAILLAAIAAAAGLGVTRRRVR
jgi:hypothetical protein